MYKPTTTFSKFSINTYRYCPKKFKLQFINKLNRNKNIKNKYFSFDKSIHNVMANLNLMSSKEFSQLDINKIKLLIERDWVNTGYKSISEEKAFKLKGLNMLQAYTEAPLDQGQDSLLINRVLRSKLNNKITLFAKVDKVYETLDNCIEIVDYKTGKNMYETIDFNTNFQLPLYLIPVQKELGLCADYISYYYLAYNKKITHKITPNDIESAHIILERFIKEVRKDSTYKCNPNPFCKESCDFYNECFNRNL